MHVQTGYVDYAYYHDEPFCKKVTDEFEGKKCLLLGNHGMITVGKSAAEAFFNTFTFDQACLTQLEAYQSGEQIQFSDNVDEITACYANDAKTGYGWDGYA